MGSPSTPPKTVAIPRETTPSRTQSKSPTQAPNITATRSIPHHCRYTTSNTKPPHSDRPKTLPEIKTDDHASLNHHHIRNLHNLILFLDGQKSDRETRRQTPLLVRRRLSVLYYPLHGHVEKREHKSKGMCIRGDD